MTVGAADRRADTLRPAAWKSRPQGAPDMAGDSPLALRAGWTLLETSEKALELRRDAVVVIRGAFIEEIRDEPPPGVELLAMPDELLLPGFISAHTHVAGGTPTRGLIEGGRSYADPLLKMEALDDEELDALTAANLAEYLLSGCTTQVEMSLSLRQAESYVRVAKAWGVRGYPGGMIPGIGRVLPIWFREHDDALFDAEPGTLDEIAANLAFGQRHMGAGEGRIRPMMAPHGTHTHSRRTLAALGKAAKELGTGVHIHLASERENAMTGRLWGMRPLQLCDAEGLLDGVFVAAHLTAFDFTEDADLFRARGALYAHCPSAEGPGGSSQPWPEALAAGMRSNIAIDTHCNDYVETLKLAVLHGRTRQRLLAGDGAERVSPDIWHAIDAATRIPADALDRPDLGRIRAGARADLVSLDICGLTVGAGRLPPMPLNHLLYADGRAIRNVMTDGSWQVRNGRLMVADQAAVLSDGGAVTARIWDMLDADGWFAAGS